MQQLSRHCLVRHRLVLACVCGAVATVLVSWTRANPLTVTWVNRVNVTVSDGVLQKTSGCDGCDDAGATSEQQIAAGDGYAEFTIGETTTLFVAGLSHGNTGTTYSDIDFAFRFNGAGHADVLENGVYVGGDTVYAVGDVFRVAIVGGKVQYRRNGVVLLERTKTVQYPVGIDTALFSIGATVRSATIASATPTTTGGFLEKAGDQSYRARLSATQISTFLPPNGAKGPFTFPSPYRTRGVRLTNATDCANGEDCLWYVGYSYWRNINYHVGSDTMYILLAFDRNRGGGGPSLLAYSKSTEQVQNLGPLFSPESPYSFSTAEGWYFSATMPTRLYTFLPGGTALRRYDVLARQFESTPAMDLTGCPRPGVCPDNAAFIYQPHSSDDDAVHSATVQDTAFQRLGCVVSRPAGFVYVPTRTDYSLDECHVDKSGRWLLVLETRHDGPLDNRLIDLTTGAQTLVADVDGALGHLDTGFGWAVGADNYNALPNASVLLKFPLSGTQRPIGPVIHYNKRWDIAASNHVAHGNATAVRNVNEQYACGSNASRVLDMADEIVCFSLDPNRNADGSLDVLVVAPVMTDLDAIGGGPDDYSKMPKGNLDVTGEYFIWTTNMGGNRLDAFLVKVPGHLLKASNSTPTAAAKSATTAAGSPVTITLGGTDGETCELSFSIAIAPSHGTLGGVSDLQCASGAPHSDTAQVTYTPGAAFVGSDTFTYVVNDGTAQSAAATVTVTVTGTPSSIHVGDLDGTAVSLGKGTWRATVHVQAHDGSHAPVAGATISGSWSGGHQGSTSCVTGTDGRCSVMSGSIANRVQTATLTITGIQQGSLSYTATANHDPDGDSDGTRITVRKP